MEEYFLTPFQVLLLSGIITEQVNNWINKTTGSAFAGVLVLYGIFLSFRWVLVLNG